MMDFIADSPTAFHSTKSLENIFKKAGYTQLIEKDSWNLSAGSRYYVKRNDSALIAFNIGKGEITSEGIHIVGAHTDSPALKVKPFPEMVSKEYQQLAVEVYGGPLLATWFDRDLSLAGRVSFINKKGELENSLLDFKRPVAIIPSVAIHLDNKANDERSINKQKDLLNPDFHEAI